MRPDYNSRNSEIDRRNRILYSEPGHRTRHLAELQITALTQLALILFHLPECAPRALH